MTQLESEMYVVLGAAAGLFFLVAAVRAFFLRRYGSLFDGGAPQATQVGRISGPLSGRRAEIALSSADHTRSRPAELRITLRGAGSAELEAVRESMATALRKALGAQPDRETGVEELDRLFAFRFHDRSEIERLVGRPEARESLVALAELGARSVRASGALLTVDVPMRFVLPLGVERVRQILSAMSTLASALESERPAGAPAVSRTPDAPRGGMAIAGPVFAAVFFVAMILAFLVLGSFWDVDGKMHWRERLDIVNARLPIVAALAGFSAFLAALLVPRKPISWGFSLGWPLVLHAALVWILYLVLRVVSLPGLAEELAGNEEFVRAVLISANAAPAVALGSGFLGGTMGARFR